MVLEGYSPFRSARLDDPVLAAVAAFARETSTYVISVPNDSGDALLVSIGGTSPGSGLAAGGRSDGSVIVDVQMRDDRLAITLSDDGSPFDPFGREAPDKAARDANRARQAEITTEISETIALERTSLGTSPGLPRTLVEHVFSRGEAVVLGDARDVGRGPAGASRRPRRG